MIYAAPSTSENSFLDGAPTGLVGTLTWKLLTASGSVQIAATTAGITEIEPTVYRKPFTAPAAAGDFVIVWTNGSTRITEELVVTADPPVPGPAPTGANLTTLDSVREFMQKGATGQQEEQDDLITDLIPRASRAIQRFTRIIAPAETDTDKVVRWGSQGDLSLNPYYCRAVTAVVFDDGLTGETTLTSGDWRLWPVPSEDGVYTHLELPNHRVTLSLLDRYNQTYMDSLERRVTVTGDWGYAAVPEDVKHWANVTVVEWIRKDVSAFSTGFDLNEERLDRPEALPLAVKRGLEPYARDEYR